MSMRAFAVDGEEEPTGRPPATAEEYLRQVRWEANRCPDVCVATNAAPEMDCANTGGRDSVRELEGQFAVMDTAAPVAEDLLPSAEWESNLLANFQQLRSVFEGAAVASGGDKTLVLPPLKARAQWRKFCFGDGGNAGHKPTPSVLARMDFVTIQRVLSYQVGWALEEGMTEERGKWIYSVLCRLELPLLADAASELLQLCQRCVQLRSSLQNAADPLLPHVNILITLIQQFFGQREYCEGSDEANMDGMYFTDGNEDWEEENYPPYDDYEMDDAVDDSVMHELQDLDITSP